MVGALRGPVDYWWLLRHCSSVQLVPESVCMLAGVFSLLVAFLHPLLIAFLTVWVAGLFEPLLLPIRLGVDYQVRL